VFFLQAIPATSSRNEYNEAKHGCLVSQYHQIKLEHVSWKRAYEKRCCDNHRFNELVFNGLFNHYRYSN